MLEQNSSFKLPLVLAAIMTLLSCGGAEERKAEYLERARAHIAEHSFDKAKIEIKNVLQIDSKSAEAYFLYGEIDDQNKSYNAAFRNYEKAVQMDPNHERAREKLGHYYLMSNDNVKAEEMAEFILKKKPDDPEARTIHAVVVFKNGDAEAARKILADVITSDASQIEAILLMSNYYEQDKDIDKAIEVLIQGMANNKNNISLPRALVEIYLKQENLIKAEELLQKIAVIEPDELGHLVNLSSFYAQSNQADKAEKVIRDAIKSKPTDTRRYLLLAEMLVAQNRGVEAQNEILAAIKLYPNDYKLQYQLASYYQQNGQPGQAESIYRKIIAADRAGPDGTAARRNLSDLLHSENRMTEAASLLSEVLKENPRDTQALKLRGVMSLETPNKKAWQSAIADFRSILKDQPDSAETLVLLAKAHALNSEPDLARETLQNAVKVEPRNANVSLRLAIFLLNKDKDVNGALRVLDQFLVVSPTDLIALQGKLQIFASKGKTKEFLEIVSLIKKTYPDSPVGYFRAGEYFYSKEQYQDALREFELSRDRSAGKFEPIEAIARVYMRLDKAESAIKIIDDYLKSSPKDFDALSVKAQILGSINDASGFFKVVDEIKRLFPGRKDGYSLAGKFYLNQQNYIGARDEFRMAIEKSPNDMEVSQSYIKVLVATGKQEEALTWLAEEAKKKPNDGLFPFLMAEVLLTQKKYNEAEVQYEKSLQLMPLNNQVYIRLANLSAIQNNWDKSVKVLLAGVAAILDDDELQLKLASAYEMSGNFDKALEIYEDLYWKDSRNIVVANNIAMLLTDYKGDNYSLEKALKIAARFESSSDPALLDTLGWVYFKKGDFDRALPLLKKAVNAAPNEAVLRYHLGMAYNKMGDKAAAKDNLTRAFASEHKFAGAEEGRAVLKSLQ